jgi:hypothetical protein
MKMLLMPRKSNPNLFASPLLLSSSEEVCVGSAEPVSTILENLRINLFELWIISFDPPDELA